jgi:hypothetical protein
MHHDGSNMRRSVRILGLVQEQIPGSLFRGDFLAVGKTHMFLRSFRLLTTARKNHNDLCREVTPLWRPRQGTSSSFSGRGGPIIKHPETYWTITDPNDPQKSATLVLEQIAPFVREFERIETVEDFLSYFDFMRPNMSVPVQLDFALADYLIGDIARCERALAHVKSVLDDHDDRWFTRDRPAYKQVRAQLDSDPAGLRDVIETWRKDNIERLGLAPLT